MSSQVVDGGTRVTIHGAASSGGPDLRCRFGAMQVVASFVPDGGAGGAAAEDLGGVGAEAASVSQGLRSFEAG